MNVFKAHAFPRVIEFLHKNNIPYTSVTEYHESIMWNVLYFETKYIPLEMVIFELEENFDYLEIFIDVLQEYRQPFRPKIV